MEVKPFPVEATDHFVRWLRTTTDRPYSLPIDPGDTELLSEYAKIKGMKRVHSLDKTVHLGNLTEPARSSRGYLWLSMGAEVEGIAQLRDKATARRIAKIKKLGAFSEVRPGDNWRAPDRAKVDYSAPRPETFSLGPAIYIRLSPMPENKAYVKIESLYSTFDKYASALAKSCRAKAKADEVERQRRTRVLEERRRLGADRVESGGSSCRLHRDEAEVSGPPQTAPGRMAAVLAGGTQPASNGASKAPIERQAKKGPGGRPKGKLGKYARARADEALRQRGIAHNDGRTLTFQDVANQMQNNQAKYGQAVTGENVNHAYNEMRKREPEKYPPWR